ncbi:Uncharacterised protein [uncultured archaeon]|nr:Uncharacterised protein [uncultured archaeon]
MYVLDTPDDIIDIRKVNMKHNIMRGAWWLIVAAFILPALSAPVMAEENIIQFRSIEDPSTPPDPAVCSAAPFDVNAKLGASFWSFQTRASDGLVVNDQINRIGNATACIRIVSFAFPPFTTDPFYIKFTLDNGDYAGEYEGLGNCTIISNDVPMSKLILAGCNLRIVSAPSDSISGAMTSMSVFNPFKLPGFNTGSMWTLHLYRS